MITKESLEHLKTRIDLVDLLSSHIDLKRTGAAYKALCPFHDEKTPSFTIQKGDTHYHCFGCGAHGDAIQFLMAHQKLTFFDAVESLAQRFHVPLEYTEKSEQKGANKTALKEALEQACRFFHFNLLHTPQGHAALEYLYSRDLDLDFIRRFQIGLSPSVSGMTRQVLNAKHISNEIMAEAGLLALSEKTGGWRDFFLDRIMFPIRDGSGAVIGFSGRKYKEETFGGKYVNTPETPLFKKSKVLFGINFSRRRIAKERKAIVVEGQIDALRLIQTGFDYTVAGQGTAFGEGHIKELMTLGIEQVYLALDGDDAGRNAASKIGDLFQKEGVEVKVVMLPLKQDPDAYLRQFGAKGFSELCEKSIDYLTFQVGFCAQGANIDSPAAKDMLVRQMVKQIRQWNHTVMVHESLKKLSKLLSVPEDMVGVGQEHVPNLFIKKSDVAGIKNIDSDRILETDFLRWLILMGRSQPQMIALAKANIKSESLRILSCRKIYEKTMFYLEQGLDVDLLDLTMELSTEESQKMMSEIFDKKVNKEKASQFYLECIQKILTRNWMLEKESIRLKLHSGQSTDEEALELAKQFDHLQKNPPQLMF